MSEPRRRSPRAAETPDTALSVVLASPWAISETGLQRVVAVASRSLLEADALRVALEQREGEPLDNTRTVTIRDGVATIPVRGVMMQRAGLFASISGATSYETIAKDLRAAAEDPKVGAILLAIDSPGGEVAGCHELAAQILSLRGVKPIEAVIGGDGCSAAYWLAAACDRIHAAETAVVGSLGVRMSAMDDARALRQRGYRRIEIVSSQTPLKALDPAEAEGRSRVQRMVDDLAAVFLASVAGARGVPLEQIAARYGAGDVFVGARALEAGLVDAIAGYEAVHADLAQRLASPRPAILTPGASAGRATAPEGKRAGASSQEGRSMATTKKARRPATRAERTRALRAKAAKDDKEKYDAEEEEEDDEDAPTGRRAEDAPEEDEEEESASDDTDDEEEQASEDDEDDDESASEDDDEDDEPKSKKAKRSAARRRSPLKAARVAGATAERARILGILKYQGRASAEVITACINDAACTPAMAAQRILDAGPSAGTSRLRLLQGDDRRIAAAPVTAGDAAATGARGLLAGVAAGYGRKRGIRAS